MLMRKVMRHQQRGFSLIEALISVGVLSFGLLAIGSFQAKLISSSAYNKARFEALALAQEKIDEIRSYSSEHRLVENLLNTTVNNPAVGDEYRYPVDVPAAATTYSDSREGTNATFDRDWTVQRAVTPDLTDDDSPISNVVVMVSWADRTGQQSVSLETVVTWRNPSGTADVEEVAKPLVESPTGKAYLGEGSLTKEEMDKFKTDNPDAANNDGTWAADHDGDDDLELIVENADGSAEVVLTLPKACKVDEGCSDFVKISGTVFFHRNITGSTGPLLKTSNVSKLDNDEVWIIASDAAYCSRWKPVSVTDGKLATSLDLTTLPKSGGDIYRNNDAVVDFTGASKNNYDYFNYTCYLGGGWYGNIGLVMLGAGPGDYACVGDPTASDAAAADKWRRVEVAKRRVYRGMIHKYTEDADGNHVEVQLAGETVFYSRGIFDAATFPDSEWADRDTGHDFVISAATKPSIDYCKEVLSLPDANPDGDNATANLFHHVTGDFVCLNNDWDNSPAGAFLKFLGYPWHYLNTFDVETYDARVDCPFDPSVPPSKRYTFTATIDMEGTTTPYPATWGSADQLLNPEIDGNINTSDGFANCRIVSTTFGDGNDISYECDYYVWADVKNVEYPWSGAVTLNSPDEVVCVPDSIATPATADYSWEAIYSGLTGTSTLNAVPNFTCKNLTDFTIKGTISVDAGNDLTSVPGGLQITAYEVVTDTDGDGDVDMDDGVPVGVCSLTAQSALSVNYSCGSLLEPGYLEGFTGYVELAMPADHQCGSPVSVSTTDATLTSCSDGVGGVVRWSFTDFTATPAVSSGNNVILNGPMDERKVVGSLSGSELLTGTTINLVGVGTYPSDTCSITWGPANKSLSYSCTVLVDSRTNLWEGSLVIAAPTDVWCSNSTVPFTTLVADSTTVAASVCEQDNTDFIKVKGSVHVWAPYTTIWNLQYVGAGNGSYTVDYVWVGAGLGDYDYVMEITDLVALEATMTGGSCKFDTVPTATSVSKTWFNFDCITDEVIAHDSTWSGSITIKTNEPPWEQCQLNGYTNTYAGVAPGILIDNAFRAIDFPGYCADYAGAGPWTWITYPGALPDKDPNGLPWTPTYP